MLFSELRPRVTNALGDVDGAKTRYGQAGTVLGQAENTLNGMATVYADVIAAVNAGATANPDNPAWQSLKAEKDLAIAERATVLADVEAIVLAFTKLTAHGASAVAAKLNELA